jgi:hypothetical protein
MAATTRFPIKLRPYCLVLVTGALLSALLLGIRDGWPPVAPLVMLGALSVFAANRDVQLPSGVAVSAGFMVSMAAVVVFVERGSPAGAVIVGVLYGVYLPSIRRDSWGWIPFNAGVTGLALLGAVAVFSQMPTIHAMPWAILGVIPAALAAQAISWALIGGSYVIEERKVPEGFLRDLGLSVVQTLPFALVGFLLGRLYLSLGPAVMILIVVPILIAREMFASYMRVKESHDETVQLLIRALEQKDQYTAGHAGRVAVYAGYIAEELDFTPARTERLRFAALMHDIGKLVVPNQLLNKPGKLTEEEFARVRIHEGVSVQMLSHIDFLRPIAGHAHSDNMRFNPDDLDHPIEPYVIMVADAYDAMTSTRSYRKALPQEVAFQELRDKSGTQFHPACAEALIRAIEQRNEVHGAGHEEKSHFEDAPEVGLGSAGLGDLLSDEKAHQ